MPQAQGLDPNSWKGVRGYDHREKFAMLFGKNDA
jgi:hypothetical protein